MYFEGDKINAIVRLFGFRGNEIYSAEVETHDMTRPCLETSFIGF